MHALEQTAHFITEHNIPEKNLPKALNSMLPFDIVIIGAKDMPIDFHASYQAKTKKYVYRILTGLYPSPFERNYSWHIPSPLNIDNMRAAAVCFLGKHHFGSFQGSGCSSNDPVKTILTLTIKEQNNFIIFEITGSGFLRHMVRNIVGTLVEAGRNKIDANDIKEILAARDRRQAGPTAPAQGLFLVKVEY